MCSNHTLRLRATLTILAAGALLTSTAWAQRGGERSLLDILGQEDVQSELQISEAQLQKLDELNESLSDRSGFAELMKKASAAETEAERAVIREQMLNYAANRRQGADEQLHEVLTSEQMTRLEQVSLQLRGMRALESDDVAETLNLTDEQRQQIAGLVEQESAARREAGFLSTDEERRQFRDHWDARYSAALTAQQRQQWATLTGPPMGGPSNAVAASAIGGVPAPQDPQPGETPAPEDAQIVASFGTPATQSAEQSGEAPKTGDDKLYFNFRYAPWEVVLKRFADEAGLTLDLSRVPPGTFNHYDDEGYTITEALDVINGYLLARGYILVRRDKFLVCLSLDEPIPPNLVPTVSVDELPDRGRNELMTVVFPLHGDEDVDAVAQEVEKLKGPQGTVVGIAPTRSLVVTDIGANLMRIDRLLRNVTTKPEDLVFKEYTLQYILADDAEFMVRTLLGLSTDAAVATTTSSAANDNDDRDRRDRTSRFSRGFGGGFPFGDRQRQNNPAPTTSGSSNRSGSKANTIADPRTNKLLVSATASEHRIIEEALRTVDVSERSPMSSDRPFGGLGDKTMTVLGLASMDPTSAAIMLQSMYSKEGDEAPTISADLLGRQLIVRGTEAQVYQIRQLLTQMGEDGTGRRADTNRGPVRTFNLGGVDPAELLPIVEQMWKAQHGSTIRVVSPSDDERTRRQSEILRGLNQRRNQAPPQQDERPQRPDDAGRSTTEDDDSRVFVHPLELNDDIFAVGAEVEEASEVQTPANAEPPAGGDVTLRVVGGELLIISQDAAQADEVERMLEQVMRTIPPRTTWSIFPLKSADATEAAAMLEQLFPDSRVSQTSSSSGSVLGSLSSGISSFGSGVADLTGLSELGAGPQTLRIIPETRLNALFVAGPAYKVREVEEMLNIIDSSGLTESLRDRVPRLIPVEFADIDDVFEIVSSVYAPEMQAVGAQGGDPRQAFAAMFGGGNNRGGRGGNGDNNNRNAQPQEPQVTLGVDRDTSHLIVSASDGTYAEIEELVYSIDRAAQAARRTVTVRALVNTDASMIQDSLGSIMPKITVSTSSSRGRPTSSSSSNSSNSSRNTSSDDQRRAEFIQRMREQGGFGRGGFGGGGDRGGRGGFGGGDRGSRGGGDRGR